MRYLVLATLWSISASAQAPAPKPAEAATPSVKPEDKCSVEGTVVSATTGEPLKKTHLSLQPQPKGLPYGTTTDSAGHFIFNEIDPGRYGFSAVRNGYLTQNYSPKGDINHSAPLTLGTAQKLKDVVFKLTPQGVISGRVLDEDGEPLVRVSVQASSFAYVRGKPQLMGGEDTYTNDLGEYRVYGLSPGKYIIGATYQAGDNYAIAPERTVGSAQALKAAEQTFVTTFYPSSTNSDGATLISVRAGEQVSGINLTLIRARTVSVKGRVNIPATAQWQRTNVMLMTHLGMAPYANLIDSKGSFVLRGVPPGTYVLYGYSMSEGKRFTARMPLEVANSNIEGVELTLQPPLEIQGRVIIEANGDLKGSVMNLQLQPRNTGSFGGGFAQVKDDLSFKINAGLDSYDLRIHQTPENFYLKAIRIGREDVTEIGIDLTQGVAPEELTVVLNPNGGVIEGSVHNTKDEPAAGVTVTLIPDASHRSLSWLYKTANTDQNGHFAIQGVRPGEYKIYAWEEVEQDAYQDPDFVKPHESAGEAVSVKEGARETVQLKVIPADAVSSQKPER